MCNNGLRTSITLTVWKGFALWCAGFTSCAGVHIAYLDGYHGLSAWRGIGFMLTGSIIVPGIILSSWWLIGFGVMIKPVPDTDTGR